jgi:hypothetical protein
MLGLSTHPKCTQRGYCATRIRRCLPLLRMSTTTRVGGASSEDLSKTAQNPDMNECVSNSSRVIGWSGSYGASSMLHYLQLEGGSAPTQDEQEQKRTHNGNDDGADATEAIGEESEHRGYRHWSDMRLGSSRSCIAKTASIRSTSSGKADC